MATTTSILALTKPADSDIADIVDINANSDKIDAMAGAVQDAIAIVANGNTHAAIAAGQFVYVRNHSTLAQGLYKASVAIGTNAALSTSNLTADGAGGLNALKASVDTLNSNMSNYNFGSKTVEQFQSELVTYASSMPLRSIKHISVEISAASGYFLQTTYVGTIEKLSSDTRVVVLLNQTVNPLTPDITMVYKDGNWTITSVSNNLAVARITDSSGQTPVYYYKSGHVVTCVVSAISQSSSVPAWGTINLGNIPVGYRPEMDLGYFNSVRQSQTETSPLMLNIKANGVIQYMNQSANAISVGVLMSTSVTWIVP